MHSIDSIDRFVVFIPKNDSRRIYIARNSHIAKCKWFDEQVFLKPLAERTRCETPPELFPESDVDFINANSSLITFRKGGHSHSECVGELNNGGEITEGIAEEICRELNEALSKARGNPL